MSQKFIGLDDAAEQLGVSKDRLNELREVGKVRAYRDGTSWKFRSEDIDKMAEEGLPPADSSISGISLEELPELAEAEEPAPVEEADAGETVVADEDSEDKAEIAPEDSEIELADEEAEAGAAASDLQLEEIDEPTVPVEAAEEESSDEELQLSDEAGESADSILLSEAELGELTNRPPSTIIGKAELDPEGDLTFSIAGEEEEEEAGEGKAPPATAGSDVLTVSDSVDEVLEVEPPSPSESFENLEELEIDLEAESSRVLSSGDLAKARTAAEASGAISKAEEEAASSSETRIVDSAVDLGGEVAGSSLGLVGSSPIELEADEDDDQVLGEGSDITLSSESSGINIVSPSDSGLALDEVPLELSGTSALGSSLDLGSGVEPDADATSLSVTEVEAAPAAEIEPEGEAEGEEPFTLTPLGEEAAEEEEDSSQVIALDEISEEEAGPLVGAPAGVGADLEEDFGAIGLTTGAVAAAEPAVETAFTLPNILSLALCLLLLAICGMMTFDLMRNIWSWDGVTALNSSILELLNWFL